MQARIDGRRAAPPRPTLLVGDLLACHAAFERLQQRVLELSLEEQALVDEPPPTSVDAWRDLVPRCRALRETLTSLRELSSDFAREVYECTADVCARAQDWPEALKALQQLFTSIYPALAAQQQQQQQQLLPGRGEAGEHQLQQQQNVAALVKGPPGLSASSTPAAAAAQWNSAAAQCDTETDDEGSFGYGAAILALDSSTLAAALQQYQFRRWPEVAAAMVLYFACVQQQHSDRLDTLSTMRCLPQGLLATAEVQLALRLHTALASGDFVALFRLRRASPPLVQLVTGAAAQRAREQALAVLAVAYRNIAVAAVCGMLQLAGGQRQLMACLKLLADRGHLAAQRALGTLQEEDAGAAASLVFKG